MEVTTKTLVFQYQILSYQTQMFASSGLTLTVDPLEVLTQLLLYAAVASWQELGQLL